MPNLSFPGDADFAKARAFSATMLERGVIVHPRHNWFLSAAHDDSDVDRFLEAAEDGLESVLAVSEQEGRTSSVLVVTGGHAFEEEPFLAIFAPSPGSTGGTRPYPALGSTSDRSERASSTRSSATTCRASSFESRSRRSSSSRPRTTPKASAADARGGARDRLPASRDVRLAGVAVLGRGRRRPLALPPGRACRPALAGLGVHGVRSRTTSRVSTLAPDLRRRRGRVRHRRRDVSGLDAVMAAMQNPAMTER